MICPREDVRLPNNLEIQLLVFNHAYEKKTRARQYWFDDISYSFNAIIDYARIIENNSIPTKYLIKVCKTFDANNIPKGEKQE